MAQETQTQETAQERRNRLRREQRAAANSPETPADSPEDTPPDDFEDGANRTPPTPEDAAPLTLTPEDFSAGVTDETDEIEFDPSDPSDPIIDPPGGRASAGPDPQFQMDEIRLDEDEHAELLINLQAMVRLHEAKKLYDRAHREAWEAFKGLGHGEGKAKVFRLGGFRFLWPDKTDETTPIAFDREATQKVSITEIKS